MQNHHIMQDVILAGSDISHSEWNCNQKKVLIISDRQKESFIHVMRSLLQVNTIVMLLLDKVAWDLFTLRCFLVITEYNIPKDYRYLTAL